MITITGGLNVTVGLCTTVDAVDPICPSCPQWMEDILQWLAANVTIWAPIVGSLALICLLYCCWPRESERNGGGGNDGHIQPRKGASDDLPVARYT